VVSWRSVILRPEFGKSHNGWLMIDGQQEPRAAGDPVPVRLPLPHGPTAKGDAAAVARRAWVQGREAAIASAGTPDPVRRTSELIDHQALIALQRQGAALESEPGGQKLGALVHALLATLPQNQADLVEVFVEYFADQQELDDTMRRRAAELIRTALANESVHTSFSVSHWREVPFREGGAHWRGRGYRRYDCG